MPFLPIEGCLLDYVMHRPRFKDVCSVYLVIWLSKPATLQHQQNEPQTLPATRIQQRRQIQRKSQPTMPTGTNQPVVSKTSNKNPVAREVSSMGNAQHQRQ